MIKAYGILNLSGIAAGAWMFVGVAVVASRIPGYRHAYNFMSELGAKGQPTEKIHPIINNFPIGILFILFGMSIFAQAGSNLLLWASGLLITVHGITHLVTGLFPCDTDLGLSNPSRTQRIHNHAGFLMQFSLLITCILWAASESFAPTWFRWFSLACAMASVVFFLLMVKAFSKKSFVGLYQRLSFGSLVLWAAALSGLLYVHS